jgi:hypothetical protein
MRHRALLVGGAAGPVVARAKSPLLVGAAEAVDLPALRRLIDAGVQVNSHDGGTGAAAPLCWQPRRRTASTRRGC